MLTQKPYVRLRPDIWGLIGAELGVHWQVVEAMHWSLGEHELARRANGHPYAQEDLGNHEPEKSLECEGLEDSVVQGEAPISSLRRLEDYRVYHFNATGPPQINSSKHVRRTATEQIAPFEPQISSTIKAKSASKQASPVANLTVEGKRQAQAAGDKLRARTTSSRQRKGPMSLIDHVNHQNRWANYKSSTSAFLPKESKDLIQSFDTPSLTSEGKRQAQVAGDKLRCRTNPIRHSRPSRVASLDHGIIKNRWSSYGGARLTRFDERPEAGAGSMEKVQTESTEQEQRDTQPSLLEVFEAELANHCPKENTNENKSKMSNSEVNVLPTSVLHAGQHHSSDGPAPAMGDLLPRQLESFIDGMGLITNRIQGLAKADSEAPQDFHRAIDHGLRTVVGGFGSCVRGIAQGLQEVSSVARQAADSTRGADLQAIDTTIHGLRDFAGEFTSLGRDMFSNRSGTYQIHGVNVDSTTSTSKAPSKRNLDEGTIPSSESSALPMDNSSLAGPSNSIDITRNPFSVGSNLVPHAMESKAEPKVMDIDSDHPQGSTPKFISDILPGRPLQTYPPSRYQSVAKGQEPRYHKPGPIHLTHSTGSSRLAPVIATRVSTTSSGYVDHLRRSQSAETDQMTDGHLEGSAPVATRFPTLAQFEGQNFSTSPSFPPLPTMEMEPLVPLRVSNKISRPRAPDIPVKESPNMPKVYPTDQSCNGSDSNATESSGQFFNRMTGIREPILHRRAPKSQSMRLSPAARLAEPFDPLEAEPSARPHLAAGIRRNATIAGPHSRLTARLRRPYSEAFSGDGRVGWDAFLRNTSFPNGLTQGAAQVSPPATERERAWSPIPDEATRASTLSFESYDDEHQDSSTVGKIHDCVDQLKNLGFGGSEEGSGARLLVYAQAAEGDLVEAIDMIDEEQKAYKERL